MRTNVFHAVKLELKWFYETELNKAAFPAKRTQRIYEITQTPASRNRTVFCPAELKFWRFKFFLNQSKF